MAGNKANGDYGEQEVIDLVPCPNCQKRLMLLPTAFPMVDLQCTACNFRAQVKTSHSRPKTEVFGAGWDITEKVLKSGYLMPPLITNFKWIELGELRQEIRFYPFIPKANLRKRILSENHKTRAGYKMFNYTGLDTLPFFVLYRR